MNLLIASAKLADVARTAARAVRSNHRISILECCRLTAGGKLSVYGTDLGTGIAASTDCDVVEPGEAVVEASSLAEIAGKLKGDVSISTAGTQLVIKCGRSRFALSMQPIDDYPPVFKIDDGV
jgi:DNA polymerase III subunit beta